jgi:hypothetical protein
VNSVLIELTSNYFSVALLAFTAVVVFILVRTRDRDAGKVSWSAMGEQYAKPGDLGSYSHGKLDQKQLDQPGCSPNPVSSPSGK